MQNTVDLTSYHSLNRVATIILPFYVKYCYNILPDGASTSLKWKLLWKSIKF